MAPRQRTIPDNSLHGRLLVASPHAEGSPYRRSIVLLLEYNEQGAAGIVLDGTFRSALSNLQNQLPRVTGGQPMPAALAAIPVRVAVWPAGQLEEEVAHGLWLDAKLDANRLFNGEQLEWKAMVREVGRSFYRETLGIHEFPDNPTLN